MRMAAAVLALGAMWCAVFPSDATEDAMSVMNEVAEQYVRLTLAVGEHDDAYVDAYYGSEARREQVRAEAKTLAAIRADADVARQRLSGVAVTELGELERLRHEFLNRQLDALVARVDILDGRKLTFDEESQALYDAVAPRQGKEHYATIRAELDALLPGEGSLSERRKSFREEFVIPKDKLDAVFRAAIAECRNRTRPWIELPDDESFSLEYVNDKPWSGYNWFQGGHKSLIQINTDLPIHIDRAIDLACHEGYPGHHAYNVLLESELYEKRGWVEYCVYPLFSPLSLIAEGSANYGIDLTFPEDARVAYEAKRLFPLAGIDPGRAEAYYEVERLAEKLRFSEVEAARLYLDGEFSKDDAVGWLQEYTLLSQERAEQRIRFFETYRSYVINYTLGKELVRRYIEAAGDDAEARWRVFAALLSSPRLPSGLQPQ